LGHLAGQATEVRALTRSPETAKLPAGSTPIGADLADVDSLRAAMKGVDTLFLLAPTAHSFSTFAAAKLNLHRKVSQHLYTSRGNKL
jgi:uncharacterized protein YbjT (DUF2867 family)